MAQLEQQISQSQSQIQMAQQTALDAQGLATQAQQSQMNATDEAMKSTQLAAQMRMAYQQLRSQMMDVVSQDPAQGIADQLKGQMPGVPGMGGEALSTGAPPTSGPPSPMAGPAGMAPGAQAAPGAAPPEGESGANNANGTGKAPSMENAEPAGTKQAMSSTAMGALGGAAVGGLKTMIDAKTGTEGLKQQVGKLEAQEGGFAHALNTAQAKVRLALNEVAEKHPVPATITGSLMGAGIGAMAGPHIGNLVSK
jgi:hypothetical protein